MQTIHLVIDSVILANSDDYAMEYEDGVID